MAWSETFTETRLSKHFHLLGLMVKVSQLFFLNLHILSLSDFHH